MPGNHGLLGLDQQILANGMLSRLAGAIAPMDGNVLEALLLSRRGIVVRLDLEDLLQNLNGIVVAALVPKLGGLGHELGNLTPLGVAIPLDIQSVKQADLDRALTWRAVTRQALLFYLEHGYGIVGFQRDETTGRGYYYLSIEDEPDHAV